MKFWDRLKEVSEAVEEVNSHLIADGYDERLFEVTHIPGRDVLVQVSSGDTLYWEWYGRSKKDCGKIRLDQLKEAMSAAVNEWMREP